MASDDSTRERSRADLSRAAVRASDWSVPKASGAGRAAADARRAHRTAVSAKEVQGPDHRRGLPAADFRPARSGLDSHAGRITVWRSGQWAARGSSYRHRQRREPCQRGFDPVDHGIVQGRASAFGPARAAGQTPSGMAGGTGGVGGIQGVVSKSKAKSIRLYNGRNVYNEWTFMFVPPVQAPAAGGGTGTGPGGRGRGLEPGGQPNAGPGGFGGGARGQGNGPRGGPGSGFPPPSSPGGGTGAPTGPPRR